MTCLALAASGAPANADGTSDAKGRARAEREARGRALDAGLARLRFLEGAWSADLSGPGPTAGGGTGGRTPIEIVKVDGGKALKTTFTIAGYTFLMYFSYDADQSRYRITSLDDVTGLLDVYEGAFGDDGALVVSNVGTGTGYTQGGTRYHNRLRFRPNGAAGWSWEIDVSGDRGETWKPQRHVALAPRPPAASAP